MLGNDKINIDGTEYPLADLSDEARQQLENLRAVDAELRRLQREAAIVQTARAAYAAQLKSVLPKLA